ncbi:MAG: FhaA domain-containing protein [Acidimicrobiia bacterium]
MSVARSFERRLERLLEGVLGRVFSGRIHPVEIAGKLTREADFARFEHPTGPATANAYILLVHPRDLSVDPGDLERHLAEALEGYAAEEGLRLEGPVTVSIESSTEAAPGTVLCHVEVQPGDPTPWARLVSTQENLPLGRNRVLVGRSLEADVVIGHDDVSRRHALIWREKGRSWIRDMDSANGTFVDDRQIDGQPTPVEYGSLISFSAHPYRFLEA